MSKLDIVTTKGEKNGTVEMKKARQVSHIMVSKAVLANLSNKRRARAHTKTKGEVSGGGKKPWRQKGTGRARAGSNRSPLWIGGGTTFGPRKERNFSVRVNKKQKTAALSSVLNEKADSGNLKIVESIAFDTPKTKNMVALLAGLGVDGETLLVLDGAASASEQGSNTYMAAKNLGFVKVISLEKLNVFLILKYKWTVMTKKAFETLNDRIIEKKDDELLEKVAKSKKIVKKVKNK